MIRLLTVITLGLALFAIPCSAQPCTAEPVVTDPQLAARHGQEPLAAPDVSPLFEPVFATAGDNDVPRSGCQAQATCDFGPSPISCTGTYQCEARDQNCQYGLPGWVRCDGNTWSCHLCPTCQGEPCETDEDCDIGPWCEGCTCEGKYLKACSCP